MAESWFRLTIKAEQIQALTDRARPIIPRNPNLAQNGNGSAPASLDQSRENAAECIRSD